MDLIGGRVLNIGGDPSWDTDSGDGSGNWKPEIKFDTVLML
jgi:hypothetical protein